ncbi:MAG: VanZ family protein [Isosphaeraceae bacterium]
MSTTRSRGPRFGLAAVATLLSLSLILWPKGMLPRSEAGPRLLPHADKLIHFSLFCVCSAFWLAAGGRRFATLVLAGGLVLAVGTELLQGMPIIQRDPDPLDALADTVGLIAAMLVWWPFRERPESIAEMETPAMAEVSGGVP